MATYMKLVVLKCVYLALVVLCGVLAALKAMRSLAGIALVVTGGGLAVYAGSDMKLLLSSAALCAVGLGLIR